MEKEQERIVICLHGIKSPAGNNFDLFYEQKNDVIKYELIVFDYFHNNTKKTLNWKNMIKETEKVFEKYKDKKITIICFSLGSAIASYVMAKYSNVDTAYLICAPYVISFWKWVGFWKKGLKIKKQLKKKLGKKRYKDLKKIKKNQPKSLTNKYPAKLIWNSYLLTKGTRKYLKDVANKNIKYIYSNVDPSVKTSSSVKFINKKLNKEKNKFDISYSDVPHFHFLEEKYAINFEDIVKFIEQV